MRSVLLFKDRTFYQDGREPTIAGENFLALMELCFAHGDSFSLRRCSWPGARDGALETALRPYLLGEYPSYETLAWFDRERRGKCFLYPAIPETKGILLRHLRHLFDSEESLAPAGHEDYLRQKYAAYDRAGRRPANALSGIWTRRGGINQNGSGTPHGSAYAGRPGSGARTCSRRRIITAPWRIPAFSGGRSCFLRP